MKTVTKLTAAIALAIAASAPAFAKDDMARQTQTTAGIHAQASVPQAPVYDPAALVGEY